MKENKVKLVKKIDGLTATICLVTALSSASSLAYAKEMSIDDVNQSITLERNDESGKNTDNQENIIEDNEKIIDEKKLNLEKEESIIEDNKKAIDDETFNLEKQEVNNDLKADNKQKENQTTVLSDNDKAESNIEDSDSKVNKEKKENQEVLLDNISKTNDKQEYNLTKEEIENSGPTENEEIKEEHKVSVIINKVDEYGEPLKGAILQILDSNGNSLDEWESDGSKHEIMLPEGEYTLHEKNAPLGYEVAEDKTFTVKAIINEINAGVDHDSDKEVCWHYGGVALYYVESKGVKEEVYCINQGWEEPDNTSYDGLVLTENNIKSFTPDADESMSNDELYNKVLDIIYHRSNASKYFPDLSNTAIRYITEFAIKNYTSASIKEGDNVTYQYRDYRYDPTVKQGFVKEAGTGNAIGQLAKHWWYYHGRKQIPSVYVDLFNYLISEDDPHPEDMFLYIYTTKQITQDGENYQNLLGVRWFNPYDEEYQVDLDYINKAKQKDPEQPVEPEKPVEPKEPKKEKTIEQPDVPVVTDVKQEQKKEEELNVSEELPEYKSETNNITKETIKIYKNIREKITNYLPQTSDYNNTLSSAGAILGGMAIAGAVLVKKRIKKYN